MDIQLILHKNWFHKRIYRDVGTKRYLHLDNKEIKLLRIYQTIDAFICLRFFRQHFLPYKSWRWWVLWINNRTELDAFGNFREREKPENIAIYPSDRGNWDYTPEYQQAVKHMRTR